MHNPTGMEIQDILHDIGEQVCLAIEKHPAFIAGTATAPTILLEELGEACQAINYGDMHHAVTELRQAACVIVRWIHSIEQGGV